MEINITYKSPEHEAAFLSELQRIPRIVNPESGRINPYWGASLYLLSALTRWPELRIAVIGEDYMAFTAAKEAFNLSQNERIVVELAAAFYNAGLWEMPGFEMVSGTCETAFELIIEAFRLRRRRCSRQCNSRRGRGKGHFLQILSTSNGRSGDMPGLPLCYSGIKP